MAESKTLTVADVRDMLRAQLQQETGTMAQAETPVPQVQAEAEPLVLVEEESPEGMLVLVEEEPADETPKLKGGRKGG
jgi:hypothetical protein